MSPNITLFASIFPNSSLLTYLFPENSRRFVKNIHPCLKLFIDKAYNTVFTLAQYISKESETHFTFHVRRMILRSFCSISEPSSITHHVIITFARFCAAPAQARISGVARCGRRHTNLIWSVAKISFATPTLYKFSKKYSNLEQNMTKVQLFFD